MSKPICRNCEYMHVGQHPPLTANHYGLPGSRAGCHCRHPDAEQAFHDVCPKSGSMPGFISFTFAGSDIPQMKTRPRWCPILWNDREIPPSENRRSERREYS